MTVLAGYLPQAMIIRMSAALPVYDHSGKVLQFPTPAAFGFFFHEYVHFLHNISTVSGIAALINTVELWRCFRATIVPDGASAGSATLPADKAQHLTTLVSYLAATRRNNEPASRLIQRPVSIKIKSCDLRPVVQSGSDVFASVLVCQGEITSDSGQTEAVDVSIGTLELMESAAWLLEKRVVRALDRTALIVPAPIFPYQVATALGEYLAPDVNEDGLLACVLSALQSSDAPAAFPETLKIASDAVLQGNDPVAELRKSVGAALKQGAGTLEAQFQALETEFNGNGIMAVAMRQIIAAARAAFQMREKDPFFELAMIADIASGASVQHILQRIPSCALKQEEAGAFDQLQRDVLISFQPLSATSGRDPEDGLRTIHAIFHYVSSHLTQHGFVETTGARRSPCPFYTCCNLRLRTGEPNICRSEPWLSASWPHWGPDGKCWYGAGVSITTPPPASPPQAGS
jgi:hypothetical protein